MQPTTAPLIFPLVWPVEGPLLSFCGRISKKDTNIQGQLFLFFIYLYLSFSINILCWWYTENQKKKPWTTTSGMKKSLLNMSGTSCWWLLDITVGYLWKSWWQNILLTIRGRSQQEAGLDPYTHPRTILLFMAMKFLASWLMRKERTGLLWRTCTGSSGQYTGFFRSQVSAGL